MLRPRDRHACGLVTRDDGSREVVVAGGNSLDSVEIFDLEAMRWRYTTTGFPREKRRRRNELVYVELI